MNTRITNEVLRDLLKNRATIRREKQRVSFEEALQDVKQIGTFIMPDFTIDECNEFAYTNITKWCVGDPSALALTPEGKAAPASLTKGLYVYGNVGTGKSIMLDIFRTLCRFYGFRVRFADADPDDYTGLSAKEGPLAWETYRADTICEMVAESGSLREWKDIPVLCIQDFGSEPAEVVYMGNRRRVLRSIIEARGDFQNNITILSSNVPPHHTADLYGDRVQSRLLQMCNVYRLEGKDRRK